jgi:hypothetical protein
VGDGAESAQHAAGSGQETATGVATADSSVDATRRAGWRLRGSREPGFENHVPQLRSVC